MLPKMLNVRADDDMSSGCVARRSAMVAERYERSERARTVVDVRRIAGLMSEVSGRLSLASEVT